MAKAKKLSQKSQEEKMSECETAINEAMSGKKVEKKNLTTLVGIEVDKNLIKATQKIAHHNLKKGDVLAAMELNQVKGKDEYIVVGQGMSTLKYSEPTPAQERLLKIIDCHMEDQRIKTAFADALATLITDLKDSTGFEFIEKNNALELKLARDRDFANVFVDIDADLNPIKTIHIEVGLSDQETLTALLKALSKASFELPPDE